MKKISITLFIATTLALSPSQLSAGGRRTIRSVYHRYYLARYEMIHKGVVVSHLRNGQEKKTRIKLMNLPKAERELFLIQDTVTLRDGRRIHCVQVNSIISGGVCYVERGSADRPRFYFVKWNEMTDKMLKQFGRSR